MATANQREVPLGDDDNQYRRKARRCVTTLRGPRMKGRRLRRRKTEE